MDKIKALLAEKAYDADKRVIELLENAGVQVVIPPKANRVHQRERDQETRKWRHLIENLFAQLKQYRAIATRYDKRASSFLGGVYLVASVILIN